MKKLLTITILLMVVLTGCMSNTEETNLHSGVSETQDATRINYGDNSAKITKNLALEVPNSSVNSDSVSKTTSNSDTSVESDVTSTPETPEVKPQAPTTSTKPESKPETPSKKGHYENVLVKEAYDETVLVKAAYDEKIITKDGWSEQILVKEAWTETVKGKCATYSRDIIGNYECTVCGAIFMEAGDASRHAIEEGSSYNNTTTYAGEYHCVEWRPDTTVDHPAEYKTVYHDPEYKTIHHEAEYKTVHHDAKYEQRWIED